MRDLPSPQRLVVWAGFTALVGALLGCVSDCLLLYNPKGGYLAGDYHFLADIPLSRAIWGHYLGIFAIPLQAAGMYLVYRMLRPAGQRLALGAALIGVFLIFPGVAYHATVFPLIEGIRQDPKILALYRPFSEPLGLLFAGAFLLLMAGLAMQILRGVTTLPRWTVILSPIVTYPLWVAMLYLWVRIGAFLLPMGFNLSMAILFGRMLWQEWPQKAPH